MREPKPQHETPEAKSGSEMVKDFLSRLHTLKERTEAGPLAAIIGDLPKQLQQEILSSSDRLRTELLEQGMSPNQAEDVVRQEAGARAREIMAAYTDKRYNSINGSYFRLELIRTIEELAVSEPSLESVKGTAVLSFDVNGLKAVNDLNDDHQSGDYYLREIYRVLAEGATTRGLKAKGLEVVVASNGGDEFAIILKGDQELISEATQTEVLDGILQEYQKEVGALAHYAHPETGEPVPFIDFGDARIRQKFEEAGVAIPDSFEFHAGVSAGGATLMEAIVAYVESVEDQGGEASPNYNQILNGIMGKSFTISDERSSHNKATFKEGLKTSSNEAENFLGLVLARNKEVMDLMLENRELREALDTCQTNLQKYQ
ncbi:MAG: hypothetical protein WC516_03760 [Patescibacteria group bacterium]